MNKLRRVDVTGEWTDHEYTPTPDGEPPLELLQRLVGGWVEMVKVPFNGVQVDAFVDEEGLIRRLPRNFIYRGLVGPVVLWLPEEGDST